MTNSTLEVVVEEAEPASSCLTDLKPLEAENPRVKVRRYEDYIAIWLDYDSAIFNKVVPMSHLAFKVHSKDDVRDNGIIHEAHPECHAQIRRYLIAREYDVPPAPVVEEVVEVPAPQKRSLVGRLASVFSSYL